MSPRQGSVLGTGLEEAYTRGLSGVHTCLCLELMTRVAVHLPLECREKGVLPQPGGTSLRRTGGFRTPIEMTEGGRASAFPHFEP